MADAARVALLARPGEACERLRAALREAGGEIVLEADPSTLGVDALIAAAPQAVLVALDPALEDALDRFDAVLGDPGVAVIFDEAELAARREGWDAARWVRHLSAKLHRHGDVLPPGREPDGSDGNPPLPSVTDHDTGNTGASRTPAKAPAAATPAPDLQKDAPGVDISGPTTLQARVPDTVGFEAAAFEVVDGLPGLALEATPGTGFDLDTHAPASSRDRERDEPETPIAFSGLEFTDDIDAMSLDVDTASRSFDGALEFDALLAGLGTDGAARPELSRNPEPDALDTAGFPSDAVPPMSRIHDVRTAADDAPGRSEAAPDAPPPAAARPSFDFGSLSLVDQEETSVAATAPTPGKAGRFQHDIADLERRIASMGLNDAPDSPATDNTSAADAEIGARPATVLPTEAALGAILILAGIGGPDAVRQILSGLPVGFARPVLISQRLDGGRYDRLVQQMARAAQLPVQLAQAGSAVQPGNIYIVPPDLGLDSNDGLHFSATAPLLASLPADESAVLLLSGADPTQVDDAMAKAAQGALVAGQSPEGCYDAAAPIALTTRGGTAGTPPELVQRVLQRWPV